MVNCKKGVLTCPVGCKYCMVQKIDIRVNHWKNQERIKALIKLKDNGFDVLPVIHPYIHGYCDVEKIMKELHNNNFDKINWKGFRYNPENMKELENYIPKEVLKKYIGNSREEEILVGNDYICSIFKKYNMEYVDLKEYLHIERNKQIVKYDENEYKEKIKKEVKMLSQQCVFSTSAKKEEVIENCIERRLKNIEFVK